MANNKESGTTSAPQIPNPYSGFQTREGYGTSAINPFASSPQYEIPDPTKYLFGTSSSGYQADLNKYNHQMQSAQWDAQLALMADERRYAEEMYNKYNSPEAQARQMREAGINPDLQGVQSSGFSSPQSAGPSGGVPSMSTGGTSFAEQALRVLPEAIQLFTSTQSALLDLDAKKANLANNADNLALEILSSSLPTDVFGKDTNGHEFLRGYDPSVDIARVFPNTNSRMAKRVRASIDRYLLGNLEDLRYKIYDKRFRSESSRKGFLDLISSFGFSTDDDTFLSVLKELHRFSAESVKNKNKYDSDYWSTKDGKSTATNESNILSANSANSTIDARLGELMNSDDKKDQRTGYILWIVKTLIASRLGK